MKIPGANIGGYIYTCSHCGEYLKSKRIFCDDCKTKPLRDAMDAENARFFGETLEVYQLKRKYGKKDKRVLEKEMCGFGETDSQKESTIQV